MTTAIANQLTALPAEGGERAPQATVCLHCGLPVSAELAERGDKFCCNGCETVYQLLSSAGLRDFYRQREVLPLRAASSGTGAFAAFDDPDFARLYTHTVEGSSIAHVDFFVEGVHCAACVWVLEKLPSLVSGVLKAELNYGSSLLRVTWDTAEVQLSTVAKVLSDLGYPAHPADARHDMNAETASDRTLLARIGVAAAAFGNVMLLSFALYSSEYGGLDMGSSYDAFFRWASLVITVPSVSWTAWPFFRGALTAVHTRTPHMDLPVSIGILAALGWGSISTIFRQGDIYFDSVTMLVFLLLVGRLIQGRQQRYARRATDLLLSLSPSTSRLVEGETTRSVPTQAVPRDALVEIKSGERIGVDGVVEEGSSNVDEALLTGESKPRRVSTGDKVSAGTVNLTSAMRVRAVETGQHTRLAQLVREMELASARRAPVVLLADRLSARFVVVALSLAAITFAVWWSSGVGVALDRAVSLLIVTCPCALGLATPLAAGAALGKAAKQGLLVKGMSYLELVATPGLIVFDKTGTLTQGKLSLVDAENLDRVGRFVRTVEASSAHPIAKALVAALADERTYPQGDLTLSELSETLGHGIEATVTTADRVAHRVRIGSRAFIQQAAVVQQGARLKQARFVATDTARAAHLLERGLSPVYVVINDQLEAILGMGDPLRPDAASTLHALRSKGYRLAVLSGDRREVVEHVANQLQVPFDIVQSEHSPEQKLVFVERQAKLGPVFMVGDGVNDAAALRAARVGIAVCGGAEASLAAADVFSTKPGLKPVLELVEGAQRTLGVIHRNLRLSLGYNLVATVLAITGLINPLIAAILMPLSSLTVVTNSFRSKTFTGGV